jgi:DNA ligase-1
MSEKLDGVRCYWNGSTMYTRNGNSFNPPDWFKKGLPSDMALDGELWSKRADFQKIVSIVRRQDQNEEWKGIKYMVFDAPKMKGTFKQRLDRIKKVFEKIHKEVPGSEFLQLVEHTEVKSLEHMTQELDKVTGAGGEGVMIKDPNSPYENRRSNLLLKVKKFDDAEATVIGH